MATPRKSASGLAAVVGIPGGTGDLRHPARSDLAGPRLALAQDGCVGPYVPLATSGGRFARCRHNPDCGAGRIYLAAPFAGAGIDFGRRLAARPHNGSLV